MLQSSYAPIIEVNLSMQTDVKAAEAADRVLLAMIKLVKAITLAELLQKIGIVSEKLCQYYFTNAK